MDRSPAHALARPLLEELALRYTPALRRYVEARLGPELARRVRPEAIVGQVLLELCTYAAARGEDLVRMESYRVRARLYRLARFRLVDAARRERARRLQGLETLPEDCLAQVPSPSGLLAREELRLQLEEAIAALPPALRRVVERRALDGLGFAAIGAELGLGPDAARKRFGAGVQRLRVALADFQGASGPDAASWPRNSRET